MRKTNSPYFPQRTPRRIAILGFGREGQSLLKFLQKSPAHRGAALWILDRDADVKSRVNAPPRDTRRASPKGGKKLHLQLGPSYLKNLSRFDIIFRSPGIPYTLPALVLAHRNDTVISSATKLFFEKISKLPKGKRPIIIGVTGTKGKGTTATLLAHILKRAGKRAVLAGNIGRPMLDTLSAAEKAQFVILELSSFQLQDLPYSPHIAVVLDIFPDHLDAHKTLREYYGSKTNIGRFQKPSDAMFYFNNNPLSRAIAAKSHARKFAILPTTPDLRKNSEMASAVARFLGISKHVIKQTTKNFRGLPHRLELIRTIRYSNVLENIGITFINDSAATNPEATAAAIHTLAMRNPRSTLILIAGGKDKNLNYTPLAKTIRKSPQVKLVVLFGENSRKIEKQLKIYNKQLATKNVSDLRTAVKLAFKTPKSLVVSRQSSVIVLFSPASASFDQFQNYADRGEQFKRIARSLVEKRHRAV